MATRNAGSRALGLVRRIAEAGLRVFTPEQARALATESGLRPQNTTEVLHRLARDGWILRIRRGLYSLSPSVFRETPLHEFELAMALVHPAAISHWSAFHVHGMTEQVPHQVYVLTTSGASLPRARGGQQAPGEGAMDLSRYRFIQVKPERFFGVEDVWIGDSAVQVTDPERTLLDGLERPNACGGFAEVIHAFEVLRSRLDLGRLIDYAHRLDVATARRLGWVLEHVGVESERLHSLQERPGRGYRLLDPSGPRRGRCHSRWMILENSPMEVLG